MAEGLELGLVGPAASLASPPPVLPSCSVTGSDGCLPGCVASLSVSSCSDPLAGWLRRMCVRRPVVLGTEKLQPSPFWCVLPILSRFLLLGLPGGVGDPCDAGPQSVSSRVYGRG